MTGAPVRPVVAISDLLVAALGRNPPSAAEALSELARALKVAADAAWDQSSEERAKVHDVESEHARGRAHAFCEALGDQEALGMYGVWDTESKET